LPAEPPPVLLQQAFAIDPGVLPGQVTIIPSLPVDPFPKKENDAVRVREVCNTQGGILWRMYQ
jgi:hypothetical protein